MGKDSEWSDLLKIPAEVVIKQLRFEAGQQKAYIAELEEKLKERELKTVKQTKLDHLENDNKRLKERLTDAQNRLSDLSKRNQRLELELITQLKKQNEKTN